MSNQKSLALFDRFEFSHYSFSGSRRLMRPFSSVVGVLRSVMDRIGYELSVRDIAAVQFVGSNLPWLATVASQKALEETLCGTAVSVRLNKYINHFAILVHRTPEVVLLAIHTHKDFVSRDSVAR